MKQVLTTGNGTLQPSKVPLVEQQPSAPKEENGIGVDVWAKYKSDAKQADSKYKYKRTEVTGTIGRIDKTQEFPPAWVIQLKRKSEPGDYHYLIHITGDGGQDIIKHAKVDHEMTIQGEVIHWGDTGQLYISGDKLIKVK